MEHEEFLVEIFPKLNQLQVYLRCVARDIVCSVSDAKFHCTYQNHETGQEREITFAISNFFPDTINESQLETSFLTNNQSRFTEVKITIPGSEISQSIVAPLLDDYAAQKLSIRDLHTLYCKNCLSCIVSTDFTRILSLPSPYWLEFADMWVCTCSHNTAPSNDPNHAHNHDNHDHHHSHKSSKDRFKQFPLSEIQAKEKVCFIGNNFVMLHKNDLNKNTFSVRKDENQNSILKLPAMGSPNYNVAFSIECNQCKNPIGYLEPQNDELAEDNLNAIKLSKHFITSEKDLTQNAFRYFTVESFVSFEMESISQAKNCFRFFIYNLDTNTIVAQIVMLNWNSFIHTNIYENGISKTYPVLKLGYYDCTEKNPEILKSIQLWEDKFQVERITLVSDECTQLLKSLEESRSKYPPTRQQLNSMKLSFLRKTIE